MFIVDFDIQANGNESFPFFWAQETGSSVDVTGASLLMHVKKIRSEGSPSRPRTVDRVVALELSTSNGRIQIGDGVASTFIVTFPRHGLAPGRYAYDVLLIRSGSPDVIMGGTITVSEGITEMTP